MGLTLLLAGGGVLAGTFGALLGLGGGILIVPLLTLGFGLPFREAVAISLMAVITTSSASAAVYLERHVANLRLGLTLELFTACGALAGGLAAFLLPERVLAGLFAIMLGYTAWTMARRARESTPRPAAGQAPRSPSLAGAPPVPALAGAPPVPALAGVPPAPSLADVPPVPALATAAAGPVLVPLAAEALAGPAASARVPAQSASAAGTSEPVGAPRDARAAPESTGYVASLGGPGYAIHRLPAGIALSIFAGIESALLGVGGGVVKVPAMNLVMGVPLRVATATSNMMIGVTASASAILYLLRGEVDAYVAGPVVVGVFAGAMATSRVAHRVPLRVLRLLFVVVLCWVAVEMAARALAIPLGLPGA